MSKRLSVSLLFMVVLGFLISFSIDAIGNKDVYAYEVTEVTSYGIWGVALDKVSDDNKGIFLEIIDKTSVLSVGDEIDVKYDEENNDILDLVLK